MCECSAAGRDRRAADGGAHGGGGRRIFNTPLTPTPNGTTQPSHERHRADYFMQQPPSSVVSIRVLKGLACPGPVQSASKKETHVSAERNLKTVRTIYGAFGRGDVATILDAVTDDVDWSSAAASRSAPWYGRRI